MTVEYTVTDYIRLSSRVRKQADQGLLNTMDIEDIVHKIIEDALEDVSKGGAPIGASLVAFTVRAASMARRYYTDPAKLALRELANYQLGSVELSEEWHATPADVDDATIAKHGSRWRSAPDHLNEMAIRDLISALPIVQQQAFTLCGEYGFTLSDAASIMNMSTASVARHLDRARTTLQAAVLAA